MKKHGASHGLAMLVCTVSAALLADIAKTHVPILANVVSKISSYIISLLHLQHAPKYMDILIYATILAVIWGVAFSFMHRDKSGD